MLPHYQIMKNRSNIKTITDPWIGTPYVQNMGIISKGTDCKYLINALIEQITGIKLEKPIINLNHGEGTIQQFLEYYPSIKLNWAIKAAIVFNKINGSPFLGMAISKQEMIMVHQRLGVIYSLIPKDSEFYLPNIYNVPMGPSGQVNSPWVQVSRCKNC